MAKMSMLMTERVLHQLHKSMMDSAVSGRAFMEIEITKIGKHKSKPIVTLTWFIRDERARALVVGDAITVQEGGRVAFKMPRAEQLL